MKTFTSRVGVSPWERPSFDDVSVVKNEPMLFSAGLRFAMENAGPITASFVAALPWSVRYDPTLVIDTRVHMLMPGWFPCIPGWHHDDVPRSTADGQPNYDTPEYRTQHIIGLVGADIAPTEFLLDEVTLRDPEPGRVVYEQWNAEIETIRSECLTSVMSALDGYLYSFDCDTFHRGTAAVKNGWRWFGRASTGRMPQKLGEVRRQVQVYLDKVDAGW